MRGNHPVAAITQSHFAVIFADRSCFTFEPPFHNIPTAPRTSANAELVLSSALITKVAQVTKSTPPQAPAAALAMAHNPHPSHSRAPSATTSAHRK